MPFQPSSISVHEEIHRLTSTEDSARTYLSNRDILKNSMDCSCSTPMVLIPCTASRSADLSVWKCPSCKKYKNIRSNSVLSGSNLSFKHFLTLVFYFSIRSLTNIEIAAITGLSDKAVGNWRNVLANATADIPSDIPSILDLDLNNIQLDLNRDGELDLDLSLPAPPEFDEPGPEQNVTLPLPPPSVRRPAPNKTKRKKRTIHDIKSISQEYRAVMENFANNHNIELACKKAGTGRTRFYQQRSITELKVTDSTLFEPLVLQAGTENWTLKTLNQRCREVLKSSPTKHKVKELKKNGELLPTL